MPRREARVSRLTAADLQEPVKLDKVSAVLDAVAPMLHGLAVKKRIRGATIELFGHGGYEPNITLRWGGEGNTIGRTVSTSVVVNDETKTPEFEVTASAWQGRDEAHEYKVASLGTAPIPYSRKERKQLRGRLEEARDEVLGWTWGDLLKARLEREAKERKSQPTTVYYNESK